MDHESGRLLDDGDVPVLEVDLERDLLSFERCRRESMKIDLNGFDAADPITGLIRLSFDPDCTGTIQQLDLRSGQVFQALSEKNIQTKSPVVRTGLELHFG
jgi:hypothetical protein